MTDDVDREIGEAELKEEFLPRKRGSRPKMPDHVPESGNKDYWLDGEQIKVKPEVVKVDGEHVWRQKGNMAYCTSCPFDHGVFIDILNEEVRDGKIVKKQ